MAARGRRAADLALALVVAAAVALPLRALYHQRGTPMEEGFMLVFPEQILAGAVPHLDFLHLYGPASLWLLAGVYEVFGVTLDVERTVGLLQHLGVVLGVVVLTRPFGRIVAAASGVVAAVLSMTASGLAALAWTGGVALAVLATATALLARRSVPDGEAVAGPSDRQARRWGALAGALSALALLYRPDLVVAVVLGVGAATWRLPRRVTSRVVGVAAALLVAGYGVLAVQAGPTTAFRGLFLEPVFDLRDGRRLPIPPSWGEYDGQLAKVGTLVAPGWSLPSPTGPQQLTLWFFLLAVVAVAEVAYAAWRVRRSPVSWPARLLLASALLGLGMLPQAIQRPDATHLAWVSCVPLALLPMFVADGLGRRRAGGPGWRPAAAGAVVVAVLLVAVIPYSTVREWVDLTRQSALGEFPSYEVERGPRSFPIGARRIADAAQGVVDALDEQSRAGERLLVGPADLSITPYSDAFLYYLFPELPPATRYIEMDPGVANAPSSGLAEEVASADWLVLSHVWDPWDEPNTSRQPGSDAPNRVVADEFCTVASFGDPDATPYYLLYRRCG